MYHFENDLSKLNEDFNSNFVTKQGEHPLIIRLYLGGGICLETLVILCDMVGCINHWNKEMKDDNEVLEKFNGLEYNLILK